MQREYCTLCMDSLRPALDELKQASVAFEDARRQGDQDARRQAEDRMVRAAERAAKIEPHLAYTWFDALGSTLKDPIRSAWQKNMVVNPIPKEFRFLPDDSALTSLTSLSIMIHLPFSLRKPYLSRDDTDLYYIVDNPVKKEWVFKTPCVAPSQWKGALRSAMTRQLVAELQESGDEAAFNRKRLQLFRLFGHENDGASDYLNRMLALKRLGPPPQRMKGKQQEEWRERFAEELQKVHEELNAILGSQGYRRGDVEGFQGRLHFFPTFFDKIGLEVINPHDRESGAGSQPIYLECVPQATPGIFTLIYVPYSPAGQDEDPERSEARRRQEVAADLEALAGGVSAMLTVYGFGAKTSSGYGVAEDRLARAGALAIRAALPGLIKTAGPESEPTPMLDLPRYLESPTRLHADFRSQDGSLKPENEYRALLESRGQEYGKKQKQLYDKARKWWEREGKSLQEEGAVRPEREPMLPETLPVVKKTFLALSELGAVAQEVAYALRKEGGI